MYGLTLEAARRRRQSGQALVAMGHCYMVGHRAVPAQRAEDPRRQPACAPGGPVPRGRGLCRAGAPAQGAARGRARGRALQRLAHPALPERGALPPSGAAGGAGRARRSARCARCPCLAPRTWCACPSARPLRWTRCWRSWRRCPRWSRIPRSRRGPIWRCASPCLGPSRRCAARWRPRWRARRRGS